VPSINLKYVKKQVRRRKGWCREYYYYRRPGAPDHGSPLPGNPTEPRFHECLENFNRRADRRDPASIPGTFAHLVALYKEAPDFIGLREKTRYEYDRILKKLVKALGRFDAENVRRRTIYAIRDELQSTPAEANSTMRVIGLLYSWALDQEHVAKNPAIKLRLLKGAGPRQDLWSRDDERTFLSVAPREICEAFLFQILTAQRQSDMRAALWSNYNNGVIRVRQQKTKVLVDVPAPEKLRKLLDSMERKSINMFVDENCKPWTKGKFGRHFSEACKTAGLDGLQNRDLRRTAMVRLAEAGANVQGISAISGHAIDYCMRILETYIPRTFKMAEDAVRAFDAEERRLDAINAKLEEESLTEIIEGGPLGDNASLPVTEDGSIKRSPKRETSRSGKDSARPRSGPSAD
jgi:integrase